MFDLFHRALGLSRRGARGELRELERIAQEVNRLSERFEAMSDEELRGMISYFRERYERGETLDELLPEAFAAVREASSRALGMRHFDEQVMGGVALHRGMVAEMRGGEGKTLLVAPLAAYLGAIAGRGVHVVTMSDYLARRDSERAGRVYGSLGMSVGCLQSGVRLDLKKPAYAADVTYGSYSEFGLDYLRDNMVMRAGERVQRGHAFAIVDGADSILIDDAGTPLVIPGADATVARDDGAWADGEPTSRAGEDVGDKGQVFAIIALQNYFRLYERLSGVTGAATDVGAELKTTYDTAVVTIPTHEPVMRMDHPDLVYQGVDAKLAAVADDIAERHAKGQPVLVGTASIESSERLSRALNKRGVPHEVLSAKSHEREAQVVAQAGREGAVTIATNMAGRGTDIILGGNPDELARDMLRERGYFRPAKEGEEPREPSEAEWEEALGEARETCEAERERVLKAGGLCVIGTERHESRRIDNQLRGRSGRQGDPGETQFYLSLEDDLMRLFGGDRMDRIIAMMVRYDMPADVPIQSRLVSRAIEGAQRKVEEINYAMRKQVLDYDDVINEQRRVIYEERDKILGGKDLVGYINDVTHDVVRRKVEELCPVGQDPEDWKLKKLRKWVKKLTGRKDMPEFGSDQGRISERQGRDDVSSETESVPEEWKSGLSEEHEEAPDDNSAASISSLDEDAGPQSPRTGKDDGKLDSSGDAEVHDKDDGEEPQHTKSQDAEACVECAAGETESTPKERDESGGKGGGVSVSGESTVAAKDSAKMVDTISGGDVTPRSQSVKAISSDDESNNLFDIDDLEQIDVIDHVEHFVNVCYSEKSDQLPDDKRPATLTWAMLNTIDWRWMAYLQEMDYLKAGIGLRGFGQRDPLVEYKATAYDAFSKLVNAMYEDFLRTILRNEFTFVDQDDRLRGAKYSGPAEVDGDQGADKVLAHFAPKTAGVVRAQVPNPAPSKLVTYRKADDPDPYVNVGRNDPCPCGSGKKFKNCHGRNRGGGTR